MSDPFDALVGGAPVVKEDPDEDHYIVYYNKDGVEGANGKKKKNFAPKVGYISHARDYVLYGGDGEYIAEVRRARDDFVAWRAIRKGTGGVDEVYFDAPTTTDKETKGMMVHRDHLDWLLRRTRKPEGGRHVLLPGPRGTGKSHAAYKAAAPQQRVFSLTLTAEMSAASLWGHYIPKAGGFEWHDGPALRAWRCGGLLIINEIDHASEDVSNLLHVLLDRPEIAFITLPTGDDVRPGRGFRCIATMNGRTTDLHDAVYDRFSIEVPVTMPSIEMIDSLPADVGYVAMNLYKRAAEKKMERGPEISFRQMKDFADLRDNVGMSEREAAFCVTGGNEDHIRAISEAVSLSRPKAEAWKKQRVTAADGLVRALVTIGSMQEKQAEDEAAAEALTEAFTEARKVRSAA